MKAANTLNIEKAAQDNLDSVMASKLMEAMSRSLQKYNTAVTLKPNSWSIAPDVIEDAVLLSGCTVPDSCAIPNVVSNSKIRMYAGCNICLNDLSDGEAEVYGIDINDPKPSAKLEEVKSRQQAMNLAYSAFKTLWLGDTTFIAADLVNADLLEAYTRDNGIWKKTVGSGAPHFTIAKNALATEALQLAITGVEARAILDGLIKKQSTTLKMVMDSEKVIQVTTEIYDAIVSEDIDKKQPFYTFQEIDTYWGKVDALIYKGFLVMKYEHLSAAIRDLAPTVAGTLEQPHRAILTVGLPIVEVATSVANSFRTDFKETTRAWEAVTDAVLMHPDAVAGDFYVVGY